VHDLLISPSVGGVELVEYVCTHPCLINCFQRRIPTSSPKTSSRLLSYTQPVPVDSGSPQEASMTLYSDEALEAFTIVVWSLVLVLFLVAVALPCPQPRRVVRE
jgi:hypothetical protein